MISHATTHPNLNPFLSISTIIKETRNFVCKHAGIAILCHVALYHISHQLLLAVSKDFEAAWIKFTKHSNIK